MNEKLTASLLSTSKTRPGRRVRGILAVVVPAVGLAVALAGVAPAQSALAQDNSGSTISLWINGVQEASIVTGNGGALTAPAAITFGGNTVDGRYFSGQLDDVAFFDRALTQVELIGLAQTNPL